MSNSRSNPPPIAGGSTHQHGAGPCPGCGGGSAIWDHSARFTAHHETVKQGGQVVGRMISKTLAKRTANALNRHQPNKEGV